MLAKLHYFIFLLMLTIFVHLELLLVPSDNNVDCVHDLDIPHTIVDVENVTLVNSSQKSITSHSRSGIHNSSCETRKVVLCSKDVIDLSPWLFPSMAITSFPGSGNTWLRHLIQEITG